MVQMCKNKKKRRSTLTTSIESEDSVVFDSYFLSDVQLVGTTKILLHLRNILNRESSPITHMEPYRATNIGKVLYLFSWAWQHPVSAAVTCIKLEIYGSLALRLPIGLCLSRCKNGV